MRQPRHRVRLVAVASAALIAGMFWLPAAQAAPQVTVADVENAFHKVEASVEQVNALSVQVKQTQTEIDDLTSDIDRDLASYNSQKEQLGAAIVQQHMDAPLGQTVNLLGSGDTEQFLDGLGAVQALNSTRADALEQFEKVSHKLKNRRSQLEDRKANLAEAKKNASKKQDEIRAGYEAAKAELAKLTAAEQAAFNTSDLNVDFEVSASGRTKAAIDFALSQIGDPYVYGGTGPNGWDCSGLMMKSWAAAGVSLPRVVGPQYNAMRPVPMSALQPGDLVFYGNMAHDGMYLGNGRVVHAPRPGKRVEITGLSGFSKAARVG